MNAQLIAAVYFGQIELVRDFLKDKDTNINLKDFYGQTALSIAKLHNRTEIIKLLEDFNKQNEAKI